MTSQSTTIRRLLVAGHHSNQHLVILGIFFFYLTKGHKVFTVTEEDNPLDFITDQLNAGGEIYLTSAV